MIASYTLLMVLPKYPPTAGGVGRYTANLTRAFRQSGIKVDAVCNEMGKGDVNGISPSNQYNSEVLLDIVNNTKPDLVHVQYEHGLYGLSLNPIRDFAGLLFTHNAETRG